MGQGCGSVFGTECYIQVAGDSDYSVGSWHFKLHVPVMGYGLEACEGVPPQKDEISAIERGHVEEQLFRPVVIRRAEYYIEFNFPRASWLLTGDNSSKGGISLLDATLIHLHFVERIFVDEVKSTSVVHEHLGKSKAVHNWV